MNIFWAIITFILGISCFMIGIHNVSSNKEMFIISMCLASLLMKNTADQIK